MRIHYQEQKVGGDAYKLRNRLKWCHARRRDLLLLALCWMALPLSAQLADDLLQHAPMATVLAMKGCGVDNGSQWPELALTAGASYAVSAAVAYGLKKSIHERRPDGSDRRSFPSGHATFAFAGATVLRHEYGHVSPWVTIGGYGLATLVAADRVRQDRHYVHDVCAGAAVGVLSTELTYYLRKRILKHSNVDISFTGQTLQLALCW